MPRQKQLKLFDFKTKTSFGGSLNQGKRKELRPLDPKRPVHLIFKAEREDLLLDKRELVESVLQKNGLKHGVRIRKVAVNADHIHTVIEIPNREIYKRWIRGVAGVLMRKIPGLVWKQLPYTEIVNWGRHLKIAEAYVQQNVQEAEFILGNHAYVDTFKRELTRH